MFNTITVNCGNGGDYEFECDRYRWIQWIAFHISESGFSVDSPSGIKGDEALITFDNAQHLTWFILTKPTYPPISIEENKWNKKIDEESW